MPAPKQLPTGRWEVRYRTPTGESRRKSFRFKADATKFINTTEADKLRGDYLDPALGRQLFKTYADTWLATQVHRASTARNVKSHLRRHILPIFGDRAIGSVVHSDVKGWVRLLGTGRVVDGKTIRPLAPNSAHVVFTTLKAIFNAAVDDGVIRKSPCKKVVVVGNDHVEVVPPTAAQVTALLAAIEPEYKALVILGSGVGLRLGEALGLTVPEVDFLRTRSIMVKHQLLQESPPRLGPPKTPTSTRTVPVGDVVLQEIARHMREFPPTVWLDNLKGQPELLVFTGARGGPVSSSTFDAAWAAARTAAKLPEEFTFHDLRHYYVSVLLQNGASIKLIQKLVGHGSPVETLRTYAHLMPGDEELSRTVVDGVLGPIVNGAAGGEAVTAGGG